MLGQVTLAQHSAEHIDHSFSSETVLAEGHHDEHHGDHDTPSKHKCSECFLATSLQVALYNSSTELFIVSSKNSFTTEPQIFVVVNNHYRANQPRAPPISLI